MSFGRRVKEACRYRCCRVLVAGGNVKYTAVWITWQRALYSVPRRVCTYLGGLAVGDPFLESVGTFKQELDVRFTVSVDDIGAVWLA